MKSLVEYINEAVEQLKQFKINDIAQELDDNHVSKSRRNEIIKFFKQVLGDAPYYCVSSNNPERKSIKIMDNIEKINYWEITDDDSEIWKNAATEANEKFKKHNDFIDTLTNELKNKFNKLKEIDGIELPKGAFKFGKWGNTTYYLKVVIVYIDNDFVPCILQDVYDTKNISVFNRDNTVLYFAAKDIK